MGSGFNSATIQKTTITKLGVLADATGFNSPKNLNWKSKLWQLKSCLAHNFMLYVSRFNVRRILSATTGVVVSAGWRVGAAAAGGAGGAADGDIPAGRGAAGRLRRRPASAPHERPPVCAATPLPLRRESNVSAAWISRAI